MGYSEQSTRPHLTLLSFATLGPHRLVAILKNEVCETPTSGVWEVTTLTFVLEGLL